MSNFGIADGHSFPSKLDGQLFGKAISSSQMYSPELFSQNAFPLTPSSVSPDSRTMPGTLPTKMDKCPPAFLRSPSVLPNRGIQNQPSLDKGTAPNVRHRTYSVEGSGNTNSNHPPRPQGAGNDNNSSYVNLTSWTTKFANQGFALSPTNVEALTVPLTPTQPLPFPTAAGPMHLTTRTHKVTPYHNAFSRLSPLQPKNAPDQNKSQPLQSAGTQPDPVVASCPQKTSSVDILKSISCKENRFKRTAEALHKSGLWDIAMKTGHLIKRNQELQKDLENFKMDALNFLKSVIKNPENRDFIKSVLNSALSAGAAEGKNKKSVMTVVVSAAAAVAAVSASASDSINKTVAVADKCGHLGDKVSMSTAMEKTCMIPKPNLVTDTSSTSVT